MEERPKLAMETYTPFMSYSREGRIVFKTYIKSVGAAIVLARSVGNSLSIVTKLKRVIN